MIVVDASAVVAALLDHEAPGEAARARLDTATLFAPALLDVEVASVVRRRLFRGEVSQDDADVAVVAAAALVIVRVAHPPLLPRVWELRNNLTAYDACYVATAEIHGIPLVTADAKLAGAPGVRCRIELLPSS